MVELDVENMLVHRIILSTLLYVQNSYNKMEFLICT